MHLCLTTLPFLLALNEGAAPSSRCPHVYLGTVVLQIIQISVHHFEYPFLGIVEQ